MSRAYAIIPDTFCHISSIGIKKCEGRQVEIGGVFTLGTSFDADGAIITSDATFLRIFPLRQPGVN